MNDRERVAGWATAASTATLGLAGHLVTPAWWVATMALLILGGALARASDRPAGGSRVALVLLRVVTLAIVLALLVTLLTNRSLALASLFALGIAPMLGTESLLVLVGCALVAVPLTDPFQPATPAVGAAYLGVWALVLLTAVTRASGRLRTPTAGYAAHQGPRRWPSSARMVRRPLIWAVAGGLLAAAVIPLGPPRPLTASSEWSVDEPGDGSDQERIDLTGGGDVDLARRGRLFTDPIAVVPTDSPEYWRSGLLTGYDGRMLTMGTAPDGAPEGPQVLEPNTSDGRTIAIPDTARRIEADPQGPEVSYLVRPWGGDSGGGAVIAPGTLSAVTPATAERLLYSDRLAVLSSSTPYQVTAVVTVALDELTPALPAPSGAAARLAAADRWLALPDTVSPRTRDLARQITAGTSDRAQAVAAIRAYLTSRYTYDLQAPVPPEGQDSVDFLLFESRRGYCVHFAAAELVLLRAVGIPARVITGYLGGAADPLNPGDRVITADRGHAWTEAFLPEVGWVRSDATPAGALDAEAARHPWIAGWRAVLTRAQIGMLGAALGVVLLLAAAVWTARRRLLLRRRRRAGTPDPTAASRLQAAGHPDLERAYDRLDQSLARTSLPRAPTETLTELACRVPRARDGLSVLSRSRYDAHEPGAQERARAAAVLHDAADAIHPALPEPVRNGALRRTVAWPGPRRRPARGRSRPR